MRANFPIYEGIDKIPEKCIEMSTNLYIIIVKCRQIYAKWTENWAKFPLKCLTNLHGYALMWSKMELSGVIWGAQLHVYQYVDKSTVITLLSIVYLYHLKVLQCLKKGF